MKAERRPDGTKQLDDWLQDYKQLGERSKRDRQQRDTERTRQHPSAEANQVKGTSKLRPTQ